MHICMIVGEFPPICGGIGVFVYNLSKKLSNNGHKVTILTRGKWNQNFIHEKIDNISIYRIRFIPIYPFHIELHGYFINKVYRYLEPYFDIIHFHSPLVPNINTKLPTVLTEHGTVKGGIDNSDSIDIQSIISKIFSKKFISSDINIIKKSSIITVVSRSCGEELKDVYHIDKGFTIVNNGVDSSFFIPKDKREINEKYILYTGRLDSRKGLIDLIESAKYVSSEHSDIKFILTGKGPFRNILKRKINDIGLSKNFYFAGYVDRKTLLKYYQNATIYVLPSYYEGLPTTLLEAMSCGIPSIATNVKGSNEVIENGENGILIPPRNPKKLAEAIMGLLNDEDSRKRIGENARRHIVNYYDWDIITKRIEEIYKQLVRNY